MGRGAFLSIVFFSLTSFADSYQVISLLSQEALVTGRFLPFKIYDSQNQAMAIKRVQVYGQCQSMGDPHYEEIFHLYCLDEEKVSLIVELQNRTIFSVDNILVKKISLIESSITIPGDPGESLGRRLFTNNCAGCHPAEPISRPQTAATLRAALAREPMAGRGLNDLFNGDDEKINALLQYINEEL